MDDKIPEMEVVKIVREVDGVLQSLMVYNTPLAVSYKPGVEVRSPYGPLMAFNNERYARDFLMRTYAEEKAQLWRAVAKGVKSGYLVLENVSWFSIGWVRSFWDKDTASFGTMHAPQGTVLCDSLTLLERL